MHRDVKHENIFVGYNVEYILGDFGIARTVEKTVGAMSKKGTYTYMAPEVYRGEPYGMTADIFSLGIVLYRLTNRNRAPFMPPFPEPIKHNDREEALERRMRGEELPLPIDAQDELGKIILKACAYRPQDRYQSAAEMLADLERVSGQAPREYRKQTVESVKNTVPAQEIVPKKKKTGLIAGIAAALLVLGIVIVLLFHNGSNAQSSHSNNNSDNRRASSTQKKEDVKSSETDGYEMGTDGKNLYGDECRSNKSRNSF